MTHFTRENFTDRAIEQLEEAKKKPVRQPSDAPLKNPSITELLLEAIQGINKRLDNIEQPIQRNFIPQPPRDPFKIIITARILDILVEEGRLPTLVLESGGENNNPIKAYVKTTMKIEDLQKDKVYDFLGELTNRKDRQSERWFFNIIIKAANKLKVEWAAKKQQEENLPE